MRCRVLPGESHKCEDVPGWLSGLSGKNKYLAGYSLVAAAMAWATVIGYVDLPPDAWFNTIWMLVTLWASGAVAALMAKPVRIGLVGLNVLGLVVAWAFRNGS